MQNESRLSSTGICSSSRAEGALITLSPGDGRRARHVQMSCDFLFVSCTLSYSCSCTISKKSEHFHDLVRISPGIQRLHCVSSSQTSGNAGALRKFSQRTKVAWKWVIISQAGPSLWSRAPLALAQRRFSSDGELVLEPYGVTIVLSRSSSEYLKSQTVISRHKVGVDVAVLLFTIRRPLY